MRSTIENGAIQASEIVWGPTSSRSFEELKAMFGFPENVKGKKFLDLGGGGSDLTAVLFAKGADAYSVDQIYSLPEAEIQKRLERNIEFLLRDRKEPSSTGALHRKSYEIFLESKRSNPERYIDAQLMDLPFPDEFFDYIISHKAIIPYLDHDAAKLLKTTNEAVRVTSEEGSIQIIPFYDSPEPPFGKDSFYDERQKNQKMLLGILQRNRYLDVAIEDISGIVEKKKLVIFKKRRAIVDFELRQPDYY